MSFGCPESSVTTLLGTNGAGKSTVMRMMAGLAVPDRGKALYDGRPLASHARPSSVASFMLGPNHLPASCSAQKFLKMNADAADLPPNMIPETLSVTGLQAASRKKIRHLSLGMRIRLAKAVLISTHLLRGAEAYTDQGSLRVSVRCSAGPFGDVDRLHRRITAPPERLLERNAIDWTPAAR
ncbi:ATP-binding cassette domain-containing protein [Arthrobacter sp. AK01]|uniref:ATP-binding cassette domain-containing protein n=1 Tax=Arthrobacter sp. AK01 TaxID=2894084 RepID=UPI0035ABB59C